MPTDQTKLPDLIALPKILDPRGNLTFIEGTRHLPFAIKRVYWVYDVPGGETRGGHAFHQQEELIVALSGSFDVELDDGRSKKRYTLNRSYHGLFVPRMHWRLLDNFSTNSVALVLTDRAYDVNEYIRDYSEFNELCQHAPYSL
jgi:WxcM-like, C-terminal